MNFRKTALITLTLIVSILGSLIPVSAEINNLSGTEGFPPEIHVFKDGKVSAQGVKVLQIAGNTLFARFIWENAFLRLTIKTDSNTKLTRRLGGALSFSDITAGDWLVIEGNLEQGADSFSIKATSIKDISIFTEDEVRVSGTITETIGGGSTLKAQTNEKGLIEINNDGNTVITKGSLTMRPVDIRAGDTLVYAKGVYDTSKKILKSRTVEVYINKTTFLPRNFKGTLKEVRGASLPTTLIISAEGKDYTVKLSSKTAILRANRSSALLARFVVGDTIRFWGNITEEDLNVVDNVEIIRNINL